jgi:hypothetical protein
VKAVRSSRRAIRIVSQCATAEEFVAAFHPYLERDSLFIATGSPEEPGQAVRFVMTLAGGETVLRGAGRVLECHRDRGNFYGMRGMKLLFDELDDGSRRALAALESRAGGRQGRGAGGGHRPGDVLECLIYDEPETESADPAALGNARGRAARAAAERGLPPGTAGDDDVTAVSQAPRPPPRTTAAGLGTGPVPRLQSGRTPSSPVQIQAAQRSTPLPHPPAPAAANHLMSFSVPRPPTETEEVVAQVHPGHAQGGRDAAGRGPSGRMAAMSALTDVSDASTAHNRPSPIPSVQVSLNQTGPHPILPPSSGAPGAGSGPLRDYDQQESSRPRMPGGVGREELGPGTGAPHMVPPPEMPGFAPGDFPGMPPTRPGGRGMPRPPMPAERTELVRVVRPSHVRTAAMSATLGALLGLAAGYLLWGLDHAALGFGGDEEAGAEAIPEPAPQPAERPAPAVQARPASAVGAEQEPEARPASAVGAEQEPVADARPTGESPANIVDTGDAGPGAGDPP